jgi:drug/metabolite transporter (DMT)-like permease
VAVALLVASAFLHALWNALLKRERDPQVAVAGVLATALAVAGVAWGLAAPPAFATRAALGWALAAGVFEGVYFATLAAALARAPYGAVYTVARGGAMVIVWPAAALLLATPVSAKGLAGALVLGAGLVLVAGATRRGASRGGLVWAAACAASIAGYHLCYDAALGRGARPAALFGVAMAVALPILLAWMRRRGLLAAAARPGRAAALRWALAGVLCTASFLLFLAGLAATGAAVALTLRNTAVVFAQLLAVAIGEVPPPRQLAGAALVIAGAALVAVG